MEGKECRYSVRHDGPWIVVTWHDFNPFGVCGTFELDPQNEEIINCAYSGPACKFTKTEPEA